MVVGGGVRPFLGLVLLQLADGVVLLLTPVLCGGGGNSQTKLAHILSWLGIVAVSGSVWSLVPHYLS